LSSKEINNISGTLCKMIQDG